ncbi:MAG: hypothetical protein Fur002_08530 [Anaerolineales bacterium]
MGLLISLGFAILVLIVMFAFGLYTPRNLRWVLLSLFWGGVSYGLASLLTQQAAQTKINLAVLLMLLIPILQQIMAALGVLAVIRWEKFDNLVDGAVYGFANGLGYAAAKTFERSQTFQKIQTTDALEILSAALVFAAASGILGVALTQFYFKHHKNRVVTLLSGLAASVLYVVLFTLLTFQKIGGEILPIAFGVGGLTLIGLYITGQLRRALIRLNVEKNRADNLLDIVIPIGIDLTYENDLEKLTKNMLEEAKKFCRADGGVLYLKKENMLEPAVLRYDSLGMAAGGGETKMPIAPIPLYDESQAPNQRQIVAAAALGAKTINVEDSYENRQFDFSAARDFDAAYHYDSISFLVLPLKSREGKPLGVLQFVNPLDSQKKNLVAFDENMQRLMESFSALAAAALEEYLKEQALRREIQQLRIEVDQSKRGTQDPETTQANYFRSLQEKAQQLRNKEAQHTQPKPPEERQA